jgi:hypothetical protein
MIWRFHLFWDVMVTMNARMVNAADPKKIEDKTAAPLVRFFFSLWHLGLFFGVPMFKTLA